jgi:hypothetical protein
MSPKKGESPDVIIVSLQHDLYIRAVGNGGARGPPSLPDFGKQLPLSHPGGGRLCPPRYYPLSILSCIVYSYIIKTLCCYLKEYALLLRNTLEKLEGNILPRKANKVNFRSKFSCSRFL